MPDRSPSRIVRVALAVSFVLSLAAAPTTHAQVIYPGPNPCDGTLQACIDATPAGETVRIATNGPIAESISFEKSLTLEAMDGFTPVFTAGSSIFASTPSSDSHFIRIAGLYLESGIIRVAQGSTGSLGAKIVGCRVSSGAYRPAISIVSGNIGLPLGPVFYDARNRTRRSQPPPGPACSRACANCARRGDDRAGPARVVARASGAGPTRPPRRGAGTVMHPPAANLGSGRNRTRELGHPGSKRPARARRVRRLDSRLRSAAGETTPRGT